MGKTSAAGKNKSDFSCKTLVLILNQAEQNLEHNCPMEAACGLTDILCFCAILAITSVLHLKKKIIIMKYDYENIRMISIFLFRNPWF